MKYNSKDLELMSGVVQAGALNALRSARSGHVGIVLGAADIVTVVFANFLRRGRDRFVLSAGHGSALLYSVLKLAGYDVGDLNTFRKIGGLPGHPEYGIPGVEATTGPLGQGVGNATGMALAEKINKTDSRVYCLCSDGDLMEGVAQEAVALAGRLKLGNLVLLWADNGVSIDGDALVDANMPARMAAAGWDVSCVEGDDFDALDRALMAAQKSKVPVFIQCKTVIGRGSSLAGSAKAHGLALDERELLELEQRLGSSDGVALWSDMAQNQFASVRGETENFVPGVSLPQVGKTISTRELSGIYLNELLKSGVRLIGGSADLGGSTGVKVAQSKKITATDFSGNYIDFGVREHAMGAILNGMAACGLKVFGSTFLVFSDYMRPSIRLAALSGLPVIYVLSHDSVAVGEDGPTHQPVEQLPSLRLIPGLNVFRPCNGVEVMYAWRRALGEKKRPTCIVLSRQQFRQYSTPLGARLSCGAYIIRAAQSERVRVTLIATGAEVALAIEVAEKLGKDVQVVSVVSVSDFRAQSLQYKNEMLRGLVVAIEAAAAAPWFEFADAVVGVDRFGMSGAGDAVYNAMGFNVDAIVADIKDKLK